MTLVPWALRVESRDAWLGWTEERRKGNYILVVNNSRLLLAPSVKVPNLALHVLVRCLEYASRLLNCLALDLVAAWHIQYLLILVEETPELPCTACFTETE